MGLGSRTKLGRLPREPVSSGGHWADATFRLWASLKSSDTESFLASPMKRWSVNIVTSMSNKMHHVRHAEQPISFYKIALTVSTIKVVLRTMGTIYCFAWIQQSINNIHASWDAPSMKLYSKNLHLTAVMMLRFATPLLRPRPFPLYWTARLSTIKWDIIR